MCASSPDMIFKLFLLFCLFYHVAYCMNENLIKYLDKRKFILKDRLMRHKTTEALEVEHNLMFNHLKTYSQLNYSKASNFISQVNKSRILLDEDLYEISTDGLNFLHRFNSCPKIIKSANYQNFEIILIIEESSSAKIYQTFWTNKFIQLQNIAHHNISEATFFLNKNKLYLIISNYQLNQKRDTFLYKFTGTHFDEIQKISTFGVLSLKTFSTVNKEIIIILQDNPLKSVSTPVYEFIDDRMIIIQKIETIHPHQIITFVNNGKHYLGIFENFRKLNYYIWTGTEFLFSKKIEINETFERLLAVPVNNSTVVLASKKHDILILNIFNRDIVRISHSVYKPNFTNIVEIGTIFNENSNEIAVIGTSLGNLVIDIVSINLTLGRLKNRNDEISLQTCVWDLERQVYKLRAKIHTLKSSTNLNSSYIVEPILTKNFVLRKLNLDLTALMKSEENVTPKITNTSFAGDLVIKGFVLLEKGFAVKKIDSKDITLTKVNTKRWTLNEWLSYSKEQLIGSLSKYRKISAFNLTLSKFGLLKSVENQQELHGFLTIKLLTTKELRVISINEIFIQDMYLQTHPVNITGLKIFEKLKIEKPTVIHLNKQHIQKWIFLLINQNVSQYTFNSTVQIMNLVVTTINGFKWTELEHSIFQIGKTKNITGHLEIQKVIVDYLTCSEIQNAATKDYLLISTDQVLSSNITANHVIVTQDIIANFTNNIKFDKTLATFNSSQIHGMIPINHVKIEKELITFGENKSLLVDINEEHIMATDNSDFLQIYNGFIRIKGNLRIKNLRLHESVNFFLAKQNLDWQENQFWTKNTSQVVEMHFEALGGITAPHLQARSINNIKIDHFMINSSEKTDATDYYFNNLTIRGNLLFNLSYVHVPDLKKIEQDSVKTMGEFRIIGQKKFTNLKVDFLESTKLDHFDVNNVLTKNMSLEISGSKFFKNLIVYNDVIGMKNISTETINNVHLTTLTKETLYINNEENIPALNFVNVSVENFDVTRLNDHHLNKFILTRTTTLDALNWDHVYLNTNIDLNNAFNVKHINSDVVKETFKQVNYYSNGTIFGNISFPENIFVRDLLVNIVNKLNFLEFGKNFLFKKWNQKIIGNFTFSRINSQNLIAPMINNLSIVQLIDTTTPFLQSVKFHKSLHFSLEENFKLLQGNLYCDLIEALGNLKHIPSQHWHNVTIKGNLTLLDKEGKLNTILVESVKQNRANIIKAKVNFGQHILAIDIISSKTINNVNLEDIFEDALLMDTRKKQIVTGSKIFSQFSGATIASLENINVGLINNINLTEVETKIIRKNSNFSKTTRGKKLFFNGLQTKNLHASLIAGVSVENLVHLTNISKPVSHVVFANISTKNLTVQHIVDIDFNSLLKNRVLLRSSPQSLYGTYYFGNISFANLVVPQVNEIKVKSIVFDNGKQTIDSSKKFLSSVHIFDEITLGTANGVNIMEFNKNAIHLWKEKNIISNMKIKRKTIINGTINTNLINNYNTENFVKIFKQISIKNESKLINEIARGVDSWISANMNRTKKTQNQYLYIEKSTDMQISLPHTKSAKAISVQDDVMMHIGLEKTGQYCGLPYNCTCMFQDTIQISPMHSINKLINKRAERVYSYFDNNLIIHLITNTTSMNASCRLSQTETLNEISSVTWTTKSAGALNSYGGILKGYISGVEYFTIRNETYIVIGRYYDPILNTHKLDCLLLKFNAENTKLDIIQRIQTEYLWFLTLFKNSQDIILVLGERKEIEHNVNTNIYIFKEKLQQFVFLQKLQSFECLSATGVVVDDHSFLILASKHSNLLILKYQPETENYNFYQHFQIEDSISSISTFSTQRTDAGSQRLCVVTSNSQYLLYSFHFIEGWQIDSKGEISNVRSLIPFNLNNKSYLFAPSLKSSVLFNIVEFDSN